MAAVGDRLHAVWSNQNGEILYSYGLCPGGLCRGGVESTEGHVRSRNRQQRAGNRCRFSRQAAHRLCRARERRAGHLLHGLRRRRGWAQPNQVFDAAEAAWVAVGQPRLAVDDFGFLHAVWLRLALPGSGPPEGVYYARSLDGGASWSEPFAVAEGPFGWPQVVATGAGQVHLVWQGVNGQSDWWHRHSSDAGETWTSPVRLPGFGDVGAPVKLIADDNGALHLVGLSQDGNGLSTLQHTIWDGARWSKIRRATPGSGRRRTRSLSHNEPRSWAVGCPSPWREPGGEETQVVLWHTGRQIPTVAMTPAPDFVPRPTADADGYAFTHTHAQAHAQFW